jgi:hypothetical protein
MQEDAGLPMYSFNRIQEATSMSKVLLSLLLESNTPSVKRGVWTHSLKHPDQSLQLGQGPHMMAMEMARALQQVV